METIPYIFDIAALPGAPNSVLVQYAKYNTFLSIYDGGILRNSVSTGNIYGPNYYTIATNPSLNEVYLGGSGLRTFTFNNGGLTPKAAVSATVASSSYPEMQLIGGKIYTDFATVIDAESGTKLGTFYATGTTVLAGPQYTDATLGKTFILCGTSTNANYNQFLVYDSTNYVPTGTSIPVYIAIPNVPIPFTRRRHPLA